MTRPASNFARQAARSRHHATGRRVRDLPITGEKPSENSRTENLMAQTERMEVLILGSGEAGKLLAWHMARLGKRTAVVERRWVGGSCPNIACLPSKNEIWSARVAHLAQHGAQFGTMIAGPVTIDMAKVRQRKRELCRPRDGPGLSSLR